MATETVVAIYSAFEQAQSAILELERIGISSNAIKYYSEGDRTDVRSATDLPDTTTTTSTSSGGGFWTWLLGDDDNTNKHSNVYDHNLRSGNVVVTAITDSSKLHEVIRALELHNPIDVDEQTDSNVSSLSPSQTQHATDISPASTSSPVIAGEPVVSETTAHTTGLGATSATGTTPATNEEVIPLKEEQLEVGKRQVEAGVTRVRRYTTERPVEETIRLRDERVTVDRRPVSGATAAMDADAFTDKVVEVKETTETPVIGKTTRVVEEVVVGKETTERQETVRDTVRKEDVEIDQNTSQTAGVTTTTTETSTSHQNVTHPTEPATNHPNLAHPIETVKDTLTGEPTPAQRQAGSTDPINKP